MVVIVGYLDLQLSMQSMLITINVMISDLAHGEVYLIQHYVMKLFNDMQHFLSLLLFFSQQDHPVYSNIRI